MPDTTSNSDQSLEPFLNQQTYYDPYLQAEVPILPGDTIQALPSSPPESGIVGLGGEVVTAIENAAAAMASLPQTAASIAKSSASTVAGGISSGVKWAIILAAGYLIFQYAVERAPETAANFAVSAAKARSKRRKSQ